MKNGIPRKARGSIETNRERQRRVRFILAFFESRDQATSFFDSTERESESTGGECVAKVSEIWHRRLSRGL